MSNKQRSRARSADSGGSEKQKTKQKFSISALVSNAVSSKQLSKTPIYNHKSSEIYFTGNRVQSDFVYIPPIVSKILNKTTKSDTCHEKCSTRKKIRRNSVDQKLYSSKNDKLAVTEKQVLKKETTVLNAEPSQKDGFIYEKREFTKYKLTDEDIERIQSTMPPGEVVIVPRMLTRAYDKRGCPRFTSRPAVGRKCWCNPEKPSSLAPDVKPSGIRKIPASDVAGKGKLSKRSVSFIMDKGKRMPSPKRKGFSSALDDKNRTPAKCPDKKKSAAARSVDDEIAKILSRKANDPFNIRSEQVSPLQKEAKRVQEMKVDEGDPYKALISASTGRLNRSQYQLYFNLRIRGPSTLGGLTFDPVQIYSLGERGSGLRTRGEVQDFYKIRDELLESGTLFEDPEFPPTNASLFYSQRPDRYFEWKRPHEFCDNPQLFVEGYSRFDVQQGELGDCWLLAAVANLTLYRRLFFQVVPDDQSFDDKYAGIFHFRFWQYGRWIDVVIDDRLPTYNGQLVFLHSTEDNEFWSALLEKAYAKLHGSYEALKGGSTCEAMEDFTGGVTEMYEMNASPPNLFKIVLKAYERSSLMGCSLEPDPNVLEAETRDGLIRGHAYSITRVKFVDIQTPNTVGKIPLLRLRNPWGNESEWNGPWSDKSPEWRFIPESEKQELGLTFDDDGEFWMSFKDFQSHFDRLEICNLNPDSLTEQEVQEGNKKRWEVSFYEGEWVRGVTAGGCRNYLETFWHNPQYRVTLTEVDEGEDDGKCTLIVALMQKNRRSQRNMGIDVLTIGFAIYYLPNPDVLPKPLNLNFFKFNASVARSPSFINLREVSCRFKLPPGTYCIVPSTFEPNEEGEFLLRVFSEHQNNMVENDEDIGYGEVDQRHHGMVFTSFHTRQVPALKATADKTVKDIQPTPKDAQEKDQVYQFFLKLAGEDGEVDWMELKEILDYAMRLDAPMYRTDAKAVEAGGYPQSGYSGYPQQQQQETPGESTCCTQLLVIGGAALCCFLCMQLCNKGDQSQTNASNTLAPLATGCLANLCAGNATGNAPINNPNVNYNTVDNQIVTSPPDLTTNHANQYEMRNKGFSPDVCRSMVAMLDSDRSGKLGFEEFKALWSDVRDWKNVFRLYDKDSSGTLDGFELRQALNSAGYHLNNHILNILMHRYGNKQGQLEFDDYIMCAVKLKTMINIFKSKDPNCTNSAQFTMEEWIISTLYA